MFVCCASLKWTCQFQIPPSVKCVVIRFLNAKGEAPAEIHRQVVRVYGDVMNRQNVAKWCREFNTGRTEVHDEQRTGRPSLINNDLFQKVEENIPADRRVTINELTLGSSCYHTLPNVPPYHKPCCCQNRRFITVTTNSH
jgi:hypothetical protein